MSMSDEVKSFLGDVKVITTSGRGQSVEEVADRALNRIVYVGAQAHPAIRDQAEAYKKAIRSVLVQYMHEAIRADRVTLANQFQQAGHGELVPLLDR